MEKHNESLVDNSQYSDNQDNSKLEIDSEKGQFSTDYAPRDKFNLVYIIMIIHGIGILIPWNVFINANSYFVDFKLSPNVTGTTEYRDNFLNYLGIASQIPNVILNAVNLFIQFGDSRNKDSNLNYQTHPRIPISILINVFMCIFTVILAIANTSGWPKIFFVLTMITVVVMNSATGLYQNSIYGLVGSLPMSYTNAVVIGNNLCGTIVALVNILVIAVSPNPRLAAIWYFIAAQLILLVCFDSYFALPLTRFYRHHLKTEPLAKELLEQGVDATLKTTKRAKYSRDDYISVFKKIWVQCFGVFFSFFVTLTIFPAIQANIHRSDPNFFISEKYYQPIITFLNFNLFALIGNMISEYVRKPGPKWVWVPIVARALLIPIFLCCNYRPDIRRFPVYIKSDWIYALLGIFMSVTSGYFSSLTMMYAPKLVPPNQAPLAGMMAALFLILGIFFGINFSLLISKIFSSLHAAH